MTIEEIEKEWDNLNQFVDDEMVNRTIHFSRSHFAGKFLHKFIAVAKAAKESMPKMSVDCGLKTHWSDCPCCALPRALKELEKDD